LSLVLCAATLTVWGTARVQGAAFNRRFGSEGWAVRLDHADVELRSTWALPAADARVWQLVAELRNEHVVYGLDPGFLGRYFFGGPADALLGDPGAAGALLAAMDDPDKAAAADVLLCRLMPSSLRQLPKLEIGFGRPTRSAALTPDERAAARAFWHRELQRPLFRGSYGMVALALALPGVAWVAGWVKRHRRAERVGCCAACGYDIRATPERCPECGERVFRL
jgi:hypothetical protein